jgi:phosphatidylserine decarboxylase
VPGGDPSTAPRKVAFVAIGAMLVGSIVWTRKDGDSIGKGEELGYFA